LAMVNHHFFHYPTCHIYIYTITLTPAIVR
jgi:hypothetical protein